MVTNLNSLCMWELLRNVNKSWSKLRYHEKDPRQEWDSPWVSHVCVDHKEDHVLHRTYQDLDVIFTHEFY